MNLINLALQSSAPSARALSNQVLRKNGSMREEELSAGL
jgi:hypothetical protein